VTASDDARPPVVRIAAASPEILTMWERVHAVADVLPYHGWVLIGGLMVQLHALRAATTTQLRATFDVDVLADSRARPSGTQIAAELLLQSGFTAQVPYGTSEPFTVHRFTKNEIVVDVLGPDGMKGTSAPKAQPPNITIPVPGGTQALRRAELIDVRVPGFEPMLLRIPSLVGAVLLKARSVVGPFRDKDRGDLALLLSCVEDPLAFRDELTASERRWVGDAGNSLRPEDPELDDIIGPRRARLARQTYALLRA
jgi:predicted nucleotidyltransferase